MELTEITTIKVIFWIGFIIVCFIAALIFIEINDI